MAAKSKDARLKLGEPLATDLADFCAANYGAPARNIIRTAVAQFIRERLEAEPELRKRFEEARRVRLGAGTKGNVRVLRPEGGSS